MRFKEFNPLFETARGLLYRSPGDLFINPQGNGIKFKQVIYGPSQPGAYQTPEEFAAALDQIRQDYPNIQEVNKPTAATKAFAILEFEDKDQPGNMVYFIRYFKQINSDMAGQWKNDGLPGGYQLQKASSLKSSYKLKPTDLYPPNANFSSVEDAVAELGTGPRGAVDNDIINGMNLITQNRLPVFHGYGPKEVAVRDDLGEIIAPLCIMQGLVTQGGIQDAKIDLLPDGEWAECTLNFPAEKNAGLVDSFLIPPSGAKIGISSKGDKGAKASAANISAGIEKIREKAASQNPKEAKAARALLKKHAESVNILETIGKQSAVNGPIVLATTQSIDGENPIITSEQGQIIANAVRQPFKSLNDLGPLQPEDKEMMEYLLKQIGNNPRYPVDYNNSRYTLGNHLLAGLARVVAEAINKTPGFSQASLAFLNSSPLVQVHMQTKVMGNDAAVVGFTTIYPPQFKGLMKLVADKTYMSTGQVGKFGFGFD
jgi:hypothetical protein